eukprot:3554831-Rhodomonas_salina.2
MLAAGAVRCAVLRYVWRDHQTALHLEKTNFFSVSPIRLPTRHAKPGTDIAYGGMSGSDIACTAPRSRPTASTPTPSWSAPLPTYARATRCPY